jgi:4-amino-4-deoxy-L-arabinose transferase-like glycosyltransferase
MPIVVAAAVAVFVLLAKASPPTLLTCFLTPRDLFASSRARESRGVASMFEWGWRDTIAVAALAAVMFCTALGSARLLDDDEPRNSQCGREMLERGDWVVPTFNGQLRTDKPILLYWAMLAVYNVIGVSEFAARLPSALAGIGTVALTYHLGRLLLDRRSGLIAACLLACAMNFAVLARWATPDSLLILSITASLTCFVTGVASRRGGHFSGEVLGQSRYCRPVLEVGLPATACVGMYVAMGFAVLAKGPIGVVMPLGIVGCYLLLLDDPIASPAEGTWFRRSTHSFAACLAPRRILRVVRTLRLAWGVPLAALIVLPWYLAVAIQTRGEWIRGFIGNHNVGRFLSPMEHHSGFPFYQAYYLIVIFVGFFPGSVFLPVALWSSAKEVYDNRTRRPSSAFLLLWVACYLGFFTLAATKLPNYVVPCYPALALVTGGLLSSIVARAAARDWRLTWGYATLGVVGAIAIVAIGGTARVLLNADPSLALPGVVALVGALVCFVLLCGGRTQASLVNFVGTCLLMTAAALMYTAPRISALEDGPKLAETVKGLESSERHPLRVATYRYSAPSLVYYLRHAVDRIDASDDVANFFDRGDILIMPRDTYELEREHLPSDVKVVAEAQRFLRKSSFVVMLGHSPEVARGEGRDVHAH